MKAILATALAVLFAIPAQAQQSQCAPQPVALGNLMARYGETAIEGIQRGDVLFQIFANAETGTWTVTGMRDGIMCMIAAGGDYSADTLETFRTRVNGVAT